VVPPHLASAGLNWTNAGVGLNNIFRACAAERACRQRYQRPAATLARVVRALEAEPLKDRSCRCCCRATSRRRTARSRWWSTAARS
jgi:hypothetical protein